MLCRIIYSSKATDAMSEQDLETILDDARVGNAAREVTGVLIFVDDVFMQVLEGERAVLEELLASIGRDSRHDSMKVFHQAAIEERAFHDWRMAWLSTDIGQLSRWAGLDGTAGIDDLLAQVGADQARVPRILVNIVNALASRQSS